MAKKKEATKDLGSELKTKVMEYQNLKFAVAVNEEKNVSKLRKARRDIARIRTFMRQQSGAKL